jgi:hypothetical protein
MTKKTARDAFLADCEPYFLDAVHTIAEFARRTQEIVGEAVDRHRGPLCQALGFPEDEVVRSDYSWPDKLQKTKPTDELDLGTKLKVPDRLETAIYRYWWGEEKKTGICAWIRIKVDIEGFRKAIGNVPFPESDDLWDEEFESGGVYYLWLVLKDSEITQLVSKLDEFIEYYIHLLTEIGGVRKFLT